MCILFCLVSINWSGNGVDYISDPIDITFPAGNTTITIDIPVTRDTTVEELETFDLSFVIVQPLNGMIVPGNISKAIGSIIDNSSKCTSTKYIHTYVLDIDNMIVIF